MSISVKKVRAFTLVELMITVVIIGILATIAVVRYGHVTEKAYSAEAFSSLALIVSAENSFKVEHGVYTATLSDLDLDNTTNISPNFTYTIPDIDFTRGHAMADNSKTNKATNDYYMCLNGGKRIVNVKTPLCP